MNGALSSPPVRIPRTAARIAVVAVVAVSPSLVPAVAHASPCATATRVTSISTTYIDVVSGSGGNFCPVGTPSKLRTWNRWSTASPFKINGIRLIPAAGTTIEIDKANQRVTSYDSRSQVGGSVSGELPITSSLSLPLGSFELIRECHTEIVAGKATLVCAQRSGIGWDFKASASHEVKVGKYTPPAGLEIGAMPISGNLQLRLGTRKAIIALNLVMPNWFSATPGSSSPITGGAEASVTNAGKVSFEGAHVSVPSAYIGSVEIANLYISYKSSPPGYPGGLWVGKFKLRGLPGGGELDATGDKPYGIAFAPPTSFEYAGAKFTPGSPILLANSVYLAKIDAAFHRDPLTIVGKAKFLIGPSTVAPAIGIDAGAMVAFGEPGKLAALSDLEPSDARKFDRFTVFASGKARLFDKVDFASGHVLYVYPSFVEVEGSINYTIKEALNLKAAAKAQINFKTWDYIVSANANLCTGKASWIPYWARDECAGGDFILSSKGIGGCLRWAGPDVGGYYKWSGSWKFFFYGCDVSGALNVTVAPRRSGTARAAAAISPITVADGEDGLLIAVASRTGLPAFDLVSPSGRRITIPGATASSQYSLPEDVRVVFSPRADRTINVAVARPEVGQWRVVPRSGSPAITSVKRGVVIPEPSVEANLVGSGRDLRLDYSIAKRPGQAVEFVLKGEETWQTIGTDSGRGGDGSIAFSPDLGPAGQRQIVAVVKSYDTVRRIIELGGFNSPGPIEPAQPTVTLQRNGTSLIVRWSGAAAGDRASVRAMLSDGRSQVLTTRSSSVTFANVEAGTSGSVGVTLIRQAQLSGIEGFAQLAP